MGRSQAKAFYEAVRFSKAFSLPSEAKPMGSNQHGKRYRFDDGSYLRIDKAHNVIEWRANYPRSGIGATRWLF